ncbi:Leucine rich repeat containing protein BspA family protein [Entamoeba marina]
MNVALFLRDMSLFKLFYIVSKNTTEACSMLHINPYFKKTKSEDIVLLQKVLPKLETLQGEYELISEFKVENYWYYKNGSYVTSLFLHIERAKRYYLSYTPLNEFPYSQAINLEYLTLDYGNIVELQNLSEKIKSLNLKILKILSSEDHYEEMNTTVKEIFKDEKMTIVVFYYSLPKRATYYPIFNGNLINASQYSLHTNALCFNTGIDVLSGMYETWLSMAPKYHIMSATLKSKDRTPTEPLYPSLINTQLSFVRLHSFLIPQPTFPTTLMHLSCNLCELGNDLILPTTLTRLDLSLSKYNSTKQLPTSLQHLVIEDGEINTFDIQHCTNLTSLSIKSINSPLPVIPKSVKELDLEYLDITSVTLNSSLEKVTLFNCNKIANVTIPKHVKELLIGYCLMLSSIEYENEKGILKRTVLLSNKKSPLDVVEDKRKKNKKDCLIM